MYKTYLGIESFEEIGVPGVEHDEIEIKGEQTPESLDNGYVKETEIIETTAINLRIETAQKTNVNETASNRRNLANIGRYLINESKTTDITCKYRNKNLENIIRHVINESTNKTTTTAGKYGKGNLYDIGSHVINESSNAITIIKGGVDMPLM